MTRRQPERHLQQAVIQYLRLTCPDAEAIHIPNGGYRRKAEAAILQGMGVKAGVPDILIMWPKGKCGFIEMKAPNRKNDVSAAQDRFLERLTILGIPNAVCTSVDDIRLVIDRWGIPCRDRSGK